MLKATVENFEDFLQSAVWMDMQEELQTAVAICHANLEVASSMETVIANQMAIETIRRVLVMPEMIRDRLEEERMKEKQDEYKDNF